MFTLLSTTKSTHTCTHSLHSSPYTFSCVFVSRLVALYEEGSECRHMFCVYVRESGGCILASSEQKSWFICRSLHSFIKISTNTTLSFWSAQGAWHVHNMSDPSQSRLRGRNAECSLTATVGVLSASWQSWHRVAPSVWIHTLFCGSWMEKWHSSLVLFFFFLLFDAKDPRYDYLPSLSLCVENSEIL